MDPHMVICTEFDNANTINNIESITQEQIISLCLPYLVVVKFATAVKISLFNNGTHFIPSHFFTSLQ